MPELPEVETTRRGLTPLIVGRTVDVLDVRERRLRWPVAADLAARIEGRPIVAVGRRGKYLLIDFAHGSLLVHLGMSGSLRFLTGAETPRKHDHVDLSFVDGGLIRYNDPRRFGSIQFATDPATHPLLRDLGPEPLGDAFDEDYLLRRCRGRRASIKATIMNAGIVVGVGNIYANEALYRARIHPARAAGRVGRGRIGCLVTAIRDVLAEACESGGTTLRDFVGSDGRPGYFRQALEVYERDGEACRRCDKIILRRVIGQRASYYCPSCQR